MSTREPSIRTNAGLRGLADRSHWLVGVLVVAPIVGAAAVCLYATKRGFDYSDEGFALLAAQHPLSYLRSVTQAHLIWGPILDLSGSLQFLRIVKLLALLGSSIFFATAFVRAFRLFAGVDCDKRDRLAIGAAVAAAGLMVYVWLPQTPAYNELATISTFLILGIVLSLWAGTRSQRMTRVAGVAVGILVCPLALAKWSGLLAIVPVALVAAIDKRISRRRALVWLGWVGAGAAIGLLAVHVLLAPLPDIVSGIRDSATDLSRTHGVRFLVRKYPRDVLRLGKVVLQDSWPMLVGGALIGAAFARRQSARAGQLLIVGGISAFGLFVYLRGHADGGTFNLEHSTGVLPALLVSAVIASVTYVAFRGTIREVPMTRVWPLVALASTPFLAAVGTNNPIQYHTMFTSGCWVAVILALVAGAGSPAGRLPVQAVAVVLVALVCYMVVDGAWRKPYGQPALSDATVALSLSGPVDDLTVTAADAAFLQRVDGVVQGLGGGERINMVALWALPGVVALVGSEQPRFGYLVREDIDLAVQAVHDGCSGSTKPLLLLIQESPHVGAELRKLRGACVGRSWKTLEPIPMQTSQFPGDLRVLLAAPDST